MTAGLVASAAAQEDNLEDDSEVDVTVSSEISVDMDPDTLVYGDVFPGDEQTTDDNDIDRVQIENVGSTEIDRVYMGAETPDDTAFGTGDSTEYLATNFLEIEVGDFEENDHVSDSINVADNPVYVNRKEFPEINDLSYIFVESEDEWEYGRFRVGENEYFWALETGDLSTDQELRVGNSPHTQDETGTQDFTDDGEDWRSYDVVDSSVTDGEGNPLGEVTDLELPNNGESVDEAAEEDLRSYDAVVQPTEPADEGDEPVYVVRSQFNAEFEGVDLEGLAGSTDYIFDSDGATELEPGASFQVGTQVRVPRGVASGDVGTGVLTVTVESDGDGAESE